MISAALSGRDPQSLSQSAITYQLRRLRLHGLIERLPNTFRYRVTEFGSRAALFFNRTYNRLLRPGLAAAVPALRSTSTALKRAVDKIDHEIDACIKPHSSQPKLETFTSCVLTQAGYERDDSGCTLTPSWKSDSRTNRWMPVPDEGIMPRELWRHTALYRGLGAMTETDSDYFFGRSRETIEIRALAAPSDKLPHPGRQLRARESSLAQGGAIGTLSQLLRPGNELATLMNHFGRK